MKPLNTFFLNERNIMIIILLNSITIFIEGFDNLPFLVTEVFGVLDHVFTLIFCLELIIELKHFGWKEYIKSGWNRLDILLVALSVPSLFVALASPHDLNFEFFLVLRLCRVFKFFRFIRFVPGIEHLISGIKRAMKSSVLVLFSFFILILVLSMLTCFIFKQVSPEYFGNPLLSWYSIFKIFTVEGWYEIPDSIALKSTPLVAFFARFFFSALLIVGGILGLSLVNSIFVDSMVSDSNLGLENKIDELNKKIDFLTDELKNKKGWRSLKRVKAIWCLAKSSAENILHRISKLGNVLFTTSSLSEFETKSKESLIQPLFAVDESCSKRGKFSLSASQGPPRGLWYSRLKSGDLSQRISCSAIYSLKRFSVSVCNIGKCLMSIPHIISSDTES